MNHDDINDDDKAKALLALRVTLINSAMVDALAYLSCGEGDREEIIQALTDSTDRLSDLVSELLGDEVMP